MDNVDWQTETPEEAVQQMVATFQGLVPLLDPSLKLSANPGAAKRQRRQGDQTGANVDVSNKNTQQNMQTLLALMARMMLNLGAAGVVTDGAVRDTPGLIEVGLPVYCAGVSPNSPQRNGPGSVGLSISIGGVTVNPGDVVVGDVDGVVIVPADKLDAVVESVREIRRQEAEVEARVKAGLTYPESWRAYLEPGVARFVD